MTDDNQHNPITSEDEYFRAFVASTRPVRLLGDDHLTAFSKQALTSIVDQISDNYVWINNEHLTFLPPLGRLTRADVREAEDGETELHVFGCSIPQYVIEKEPPLLDALSRLPTSDTPSLSVTTLFSRRNFTRDVAAAIVQDFDGMATPIERQAALPPLEYILVIPVLWGATRFVGSFLDELGKAVGQSFASKISSWSKRSKDPERTAVFALSFELPDGGMIDGFILALPVELESSVDSALSASEQLAEIAGVQNEFCIFPNMKRAAYFLHGSVWRLGWWTDGEQTVLTEWFRSNPPDITGVIGNPES